MMADYEYTFATNLHAKLKEKIVGKIFVGYARGNTLFVTIESFGDVKYTVYIDNFAEKIKHGYSSDYAVYEIVEAYKKYLMTRYFR